MPCGSHGSGLRYCNCFLQLQRFPGRHSIEICIGVKCWGGDVSWYIVYEFSFKGGPGHDAMLEGRYGGLGERM